MSNVQVAQQELTREGTRQIVAKVDNSPLPPASELANLQAVDTRLVPFVVEEIQKENEFRRKILNRREYVYSFLNVTGLIFGTLLAASALMASCYLVMQGHRWAGGTLGVSTIIGVVSTIINAGNNARKAETTETTHKKRKKK